MVRYPTPHPAKGELALRRVLIREVAVAYGCSAHYVSRILNGYEAPSPRFRTFLVQFLGKPDAELFHAEPETVSA